MGTHIIVGVHITDRIRNIAKVQALLSEYGCFIKTRLGLHETSKESCSSSGIVVLEMLDDMTKTEELIAKLSDVTGVEVQKMVFDHK